MYQSRIDIDSYPSKAGLTHVQFTNNGQLNEHYDVDLLFAFDKIWQEWRNVVYAPGLMQPLNFFGSLNNLIEIWILYSLYIIMDIVVNYEFCYVGH